MAGNFQQDLRGGLRMLKKSPGFTFVAVLSLALGIGANTAIFTIINAVFLHPLPVEEPSRLAEMFTRDTLTFNANANFQLTGTSLPNYEDYRDQNNVFSGLATVTFPIPLNWGGQAEPQQLNASLVSGNFFDVLGVKAYRGRTFIFDGDKKIGGNPEVVLSYSLWARRFGSDEKFIGQTIMLNGAPYNVVGVAPPGFKGIVLLIACVNLANLLLAQASKREKELSIRAAMGAGRSRLVRQLLTESTVLSLLGGVAGLLVAYWGRNVLWSFRPPFLVDGSVDLSFDARVLGFTLLISLLTGLVFGIIPSIT